MAQETIKINIDASKSISTLKKLDKQIDSTKDGLESINKIKTDKLKNNLDELIDGLKQLDKFNAESLENEFAEVGSEVGETSAEIMSLDELLNALNKISLEGLEGEFAEVGAEATETNGDIVRTGESTERLNRISLEGLEGEFSEVGGEAKETNNDVKNLIKSINSLNNTKVNDKFSGATRSMNGFFNTFNNHLLAMQSLMSEIFSFSSQAVQSAMEIDSAVREMTYQFSTLNGGDANSMGYSELLSLDTEDWAKVQKSAQLTSFSIDDVVASGTELAKSGIGVSTSADIIASSMYNAQMTGYGLEQTIHSVSGLANNFGADLKNSETAGLDYIRMLDKVTMAADATASDFSDIIQGMNYMAPMASTSGVSDTESMALVAVLGDMGLEASKGARVLASGLQKIYAPTAEASGALDALGISGYEADGSVKPLIPLVEELGIALEGLTDQESSEFMRSVFGATSTKAWGAIFSSSIEELYDVEKQIRESGGYTMTKAIQVLGELNDEQAEAFRTEYSKLNNVDDQNRLIEETLAKHNPLLLLDGYMEQLGMFKTEIGLRLGEDLVQTWVKVKDGVSLVTDQMLEDVNKINEALNLDAFGSKSEMLSSLIADAIQLIVLLGSIGLASWYMRLVGPLGLMAGGLFLIIKNVDDLESRMVEFSSFMADDVILPLIDFFNKNEEQIDRTVGKVLDLAGAIGKDLWGALTENTDGGTILDALEKSIDGLTEFWDNNGEGILEGLVNIAKMVGEVITSLAGASGGVKFGEMFSNITELIYDIMVLLPDFVYEWIIWSRIISALNLIPVAKGLGSMALSIPKIFNAIKGITTLGIGAKFTSFLSLAKLGLSTTGASILSGVTTFFGSLTVASVAGASAVVAGLGATLIGGFVELDRQIKPLMETSGTSWMEKVALGANMTIQSNPFFGGTTMWVGITEVTERVFGVGGTLQGKLQSWSDWTLSMFTTLFTTATANFTTFCENIVNGFTNTGTRIMSGFTKLKDSILGLPATVSGAMSDMWSSINEWVPKILSALNPLSNFKMPSFSMPSFDIPSFGGLAFGSQSGSSISTTNNITNYGMSVSRGGRQFAVGVDNI